MHDVVPGIEFDRDRMLAACGPELMATARAMKRVRDGVPFREAYRQAAVESELFDDPVDRALEAYLVDGYPGRVDIVTLRRRLSTHDRWLERPGSGHET